MSLKETVGKEMIVAMKAKNAIAKEALRALKTALINAESEKGANGEVSKEKEMQILKKLVKQRKDSSVIYFANDRHAAAEAELAEARVLEAYLPEQMSDEEVREKVLAIIAETGAESMKDMGKVMGRASKELAGKADGKLISNIVKSELA